MDSAEVAPERRARSSKRPALVGFQLRLNDPSPSASTELIFCQAPPRALRSTRTCPWEAPALPRIDTALPSSTEWPVATPGELDGCFGTVAPPVDAPAEAGTV